MSWWGVDTDLFITSYVFENTYVNVDINGNTADATASADAYGNDTFSFAGTRTYTDYDESHSAAVSNSVTDDENRGHHHHKYY